MCDNILLEKEIDGSCGKIKFYSKDGIQVVEKESFKHDYSVELEFECLKKLEVLNSDHFCKAIELIPSSSSGKSRLITKRVFGKTLKELSQYTKDDEYLSLVYRTLIAAYIMNSQLSMVHNDLHTKNVVCEKTGADFQVYVFPDGEELSFKTFGKSPVIIDFGLAFSGNLTGKMLTPTIFPGIFPHKNHKLKDISPLYFMIERLKYSKAIKTGYYIYANQYLNNDLPILNETLFSLFKGDGKKGVDGLSKFEYLFYNTSKFDLLSAQIELPLKSLKAYTDQKEIDDIYLNSGFEELSELEIKNILDGNHENFEDIEKKQKLLKLVDVITHFLEIYLDKSERTVQDIYNKLQYTDIRGFVELLMQTVNYKKGDVVSVYNVENRTTTIITLSESFATDLNMNNAKFC